MVYSSDKVQKSILNWASCNKVCSLLPAKIAKKHTVKFKKCKLQMNQS